MAAIPSFSPTTSYARMSTLAYPTVTPTANAVAAAVTFSVAEILSGMILRDTASSARADLVPTAANIVAGINGCQANTSFRTIIRNTSSGAGSITVTTNTGITLSGTMTIAYLTQKEFLVVVTSVVPGAEAVTFYSMGPSTF